MSTETGESSGIDLEKVESLIEDRLSAKLSAFQSAIATEMAKQITGATGRVKKDLSSEFQSQLEEISTQLKTAKEQPQSPAPGVTPEVTSDAAGGLSPEALTRIIEAKVKDATAAERSQYQQQLERQSQQIEALQAQTTESQQREEQSRKEATLARIEAAFVERAGDMIINPHKFFRYLQSVDGTLEINLEEQEAFVKTGRADTFGHEIKIKAVDALPELLKKAEYSHWVKPRPGSGSGEQPGNNSGGSQSKYFGVNSNVSANDLVAMMKQGKEQELIQDLIAAENSAT